MVCSDVFFTSFTIVFLTWIFLYVAMHSPRPALGAGMGRAIEMPVSAFGTLLGISLLNRCSVSVTLVVYAMLLVFTGALFYRELLNSVMLQSPAGIMMPMPFPADNVIPFPTAGRAENCHAFSGTEKNTEEDNGNLAAANDATANEAEEDNAPATALSANREEDIKQKYALTNRETEALQLLLNGSSITEIADNLFITPRTVKYHISHILQKTGAKSQHELQYIFSQKDNGN